MSDLTDQPFATGGVLPEGHRYAFVEPDPPERFYPRTVTSTSIRTILQRAGRWYFTGPGDHLYRTETRLWRCSDCETDCTAETRCRCCESTKEQA